MSRFHVVIPARYQSSRLPAKPLARIGDKAMVIHVCDRARQSGAKTVIVATDHQQIYDEVNASGYTAVLTREDHPSGSDRVYEAIESLKLEDDEIIVNVQGDEPFIPASNISLVASLLEEKTFQMSTLCCQITDSKELIDPNIVKVIFDKNNKAIYFSRSVIPFNREKKIVESEPLDADYYRHIGIYAYRKSFLKQYIGWQPSRLELTESLEQLRVIENGYSIGISNISEKPPHGVDTQNDLEAAREFYQQQGQKYR